MIELGLGTQPFEFDKGAECDKEMVGLRRDGASRRLFQRSILFERTVILFHFPPSLVDCREMGSIQCHITRHQIEDTRTPVSVCEELLGEQQGEVHTF